MLLSMDAGTLRAWLEHNEDAEQVEPDEYTLDLFDVSTPVSLDLVLTKKGVDVLAALEMQYDEALDGWYLGEKIKDAARIEALLAEALAQ